jgi:putative ABC transport system permease protein
MDTLFQDLRYAVRSLLRSPGLTATALLTLALGIGANTSLFSLINGALWSTPPGVRDADGLFWISDISSERGRRAIGVSYRDFLSIQDRAGTFSEMAAFTDAQVAVAAGGEPERLTAEVVTGNYFSVLRMRPALGRGFLSEEDLTPGTHPVAVINYDLWQSRFGGASDVAGRQITVNGTSFTVVGVAPEGFRGLSDFDDSADLWLTTMMYAVAMPGWGDIMEVDYGGRLFNSVGRLGEGVSREEALASVATLMSQAASEYPKAYEGVSAGLFPFRGVTGPMGGSGVLEMLALAAAVTLVVLLIACANVANLLLARAAGRRREIAIRSAVGASRGRIVRQLLTESLVLATAGGTAGLVVALWMVEIFTAAAPMPFPLPVALDGRVLVATSILAVLTALAFGLAPAFRTSRTEVTPDLKGETRSSRERIRPQNALVIVQLALSMMLLVGAALLVRTMWGLVMVDRAQPVREEVIALSLDLRVQGYSDEASLAFKQQLLERAAAVPGVESVSLTARVPYESFLVSNRITLEGGRNGGGEPGTEESLLLHTVWPDFLRTLAIPLQRGRDFTARDRKGAPPVALVNETAARQLWPGEDPLGKRFRTGADTLPWTTVVGVVADAGYDRRYSVVPRAAIYASELQMGEFFSEATLLARTRGPSVGLAGALRSEIHAMDPDLPVFSVRTLGQIIDQQRSGGWLAGGLMVVFGGLAFALSLIGLHGVVAYTVVRRTREVGIRISLGASRRQILELFGAYVLRLAAMGLAVGLLLAAGLARVLSAMVSELRPADVLAFSVVALLLLVVTLFAAYLPARRATRVDPMVALRSE